jgi:anti-sigma factor (TIGR02949 family)
MSVDPNPAPMDCTDIERLLDAWLDGEMDAKDAADAAAHLEACDPCRAEASRRRAIRDGLRSSLRAAMGPESEATAAPEELRERIAEAIARERRPLWRRALAPIPLVAAAAACALAVLLVMATSGASNLLVEEAVQRHARGLPLEITAAGTATDAVPEWFKGKLDFNPRPPRFARPDMRLVGARLSHISDRPAAYMRYELPRGHAGLFIVEDHDGRLFPARVFLSDDRQRVRIVAARGYNIAIWHHNGIAYSLVSDLDAAQLEGLLEAVALEGR